MRLRLGQYIKKLVSFMFMLTLMSSLSGTVFPQEKVSAEKEPNDTITAATQVEPNKPVQISINPQGDIDWFKIDIPAKGYLKVQAKDIPDNITPEIMFASYDEWGTEEPEKIRSWHRLTDACYIPEPGTYYFAIRDDFDDEYSPGIMKIMPRILEDLDKFEPNNNLKNASQVAPGSVGDIAIYPIEDVDCFKITANEQGYVDIKIKGQLDRVVPEIRYSTYDEWADPPQTVIRSWKRLPDACPVEVGKEYYMEIRDDFNDATEDKTFSVKFGFINEMDPSEPNNTFENAKETVLGEIISLSMFPLEDIDIYMINSGSSDMINFKIRNKPEDIDPEIRFFKYIDDFTEPQASGGWQRLPCTVKVDPGETYYFCVRDAFNDASSTSVFDISIEGNNMASMENTTEDEKDTKAKDPGNIEETPEPENINTDNSQVSQQDAAATITDEEKQALIEARKKQRDEMLKQRQERQRREAERRKRRAELEKKRREAKQALQQ